MEITKVEHLGGCHCGKVKWSVLASDRPTGRVTLGFCTLSCSCIEKNFQSFSILVVQCSCSICEMKQNHHFIVPKEDFRLLCGESELTEYTFNTHAAR